MSNFLNIHIVQTVPLSCLNRDDTGAPKTVHFGGTDRARLSSQALKRAKRVAFEARSNGDRTARTKFAAADVIERAISIADDQQLTLEDAQTTKLDKLATKEVTTLVKKVADKNDGDKDDDDKGDTLVWLAERELDTLASKVLAAVSTDTDDVDDWVTSSTSSLAIAAFGRMFANQPHRQTEAAIQVAHAFTTHAALVEVDYFTAYDDQRLARTGEPGAGHLDVALYTAGTFYQYLNIDRNQLLANWNDSDDNGAGERVEALLRAIILELPNGRVNGTAPQTLPAIVALDVSSQPVSLADAFEQPVVAADTTGGFEQPTVERFTGFRTRAHEVAPSLFGGSRTYDRSDETSPSIDDIVADAAGWVLDGSL